MEGLEGPQPQEKKDNQPNATPQPAGGAPANLSSATIGSRQLGNIYTPGTTLGMLYYDIVQRSIDAYLNFRSEQLGEAKYAPYSPIDHERFLEILKTNDRLDVVNEFLRGRGIHYIEAPDDESPRSKGTIEALAYCIPARLYDPSKAPYPNLAAAVFDQDGVVTSPPHFDAWKAVYDPELSRRGQGLFSLDEYDTLVSGKDRYIGTAAFFHSRGIDLTKDEVRQIADTKNAKIQTMLTRELIKEHQETTAFIRALRTPMVHSPDDPAVLTAIASASKSTIKVLKAKGLLKHFDVIIGGRSTEFLKLNKKPDPQPFIEAARRIGAPLDRCIAVEDAPAGIGACKKAGFSYVIGISHLDKNVEPLYREGADMVVPSMVYIRLGRLRQDLDMRLQMSLISPPPRDPVF